MKTIDTAPYQLAESILSDPAQCRRYDEAKMHWVGDPDPEERTEGRHPWVKRVHDDNEYVYSLPVASGFSPDGTLLVVKKDPWHPDSDPHAWFVGQHHLPTGEVREPDILAAHVSRYGHLWLQTIQAGSPARGVARHRLPRDQQRIEAQLDTDYTTDHIRYSNGLFERREFAELCGLEAMMRVVCELKQLKLPRTLAPQLARTAVELVA